MQFPGLLDLLERIKELESCEIKIDRSTDRKEDPSEVYIDILQASSETLKHLRVVGTYCSWKLK